MSRHDADLELALRLADAADAITSSRFRSHDLAVERKPDRTPVTDADVAVEDAIRTVLSAERPDDVVMGEERGGTLDAARVWVVDPIDGTKNFLRGVPIWASLIALVVDGTPVVGVVSAPALGRRWWAAAGSGAFASDAAGERAISVSGVRSLEDAYVSTTDLKTWVQYRTREAFLRLVDATWESRAFGDFYQHCLVAEGAIDIAAEAVANPWDIAPFQVLVTEAGGRFSSLDGVPRYDEGNVLATNGHLHSDALKLLAE